MSRPTASTDVFQAIADPTRRRLLDRLAEGESPVKALAEPFDVTLPAISQHLRVLREVGLVGERRDGRHRLYHLRPEPLAEVAEWIGTYERFWRDRLEALGDHLDEA